jgi:tetratricopeptide (TPR) repeat protein
MAGVEHNLGGRGDPRLREQAVRRAVAAADRQGLPADAIHVLLTLAQAQGESGKREVALATYADAAKRAKALGDAALLAKVRRGWGSLLADLNRREGAERQLKQAVADADRAGDAALAGRARVALGIVLQHGNKPDEAQPLLEESLKHLHPSHPDAARARAHLGALTTGGPCGCGATGDALAVALRETVRGRVPGDLLKDLDVTYEDDDFNVKVHLSRQPTQVELEQLNQVINDALTEYRDRLDGKA